MQRLKAKAAIVTGASSGIGRATAVALAREGADVLLVARREAALREAAEAAEQAGGRARVLVQDVGEDGADERVVAEAIGAFGRLDVLVNNAAAMHGVTLAETDAARLDQMLRVSLRAPYLLTRAALPHLIQAGGGAVVNISSISGKQGMAGLSAYCAAKHGVQGFSEALFEEVREQGVKVTTLCPGMVNTDAVAGAPGLDPARMIQAEDVADCVLYVVTTPPTVCPVDITLRPQRTPYVSRG